MTNKTKIYFTIITFIVGFMIAIQFQTVQKPNSRELSDAWQLRESINNEMDLQAKLLKEIRYHDQKLQDYNFENINNKEDVLEQTILELKKEAGLTELNAPGLVLTIDSIDTGMIIEPTNMPISPIILQRLINELNMYGAKHLSIDGERYINTTVIRDINGETKVGTHAIRSLPFRIHVIVESMEVAEKMYNRLQISPVLDDFFIDNLQLNVSKPEESVSVPAYVDPIVIRDIEPVEEKGER